MQSYVYKITFEETPHFYIGLRTHSDPRSDSYLGSPITHKSYWRIYTPKKDILCIYDSREEAYAAEKLIISQNWKSIYCLNEAMGASMSPECSRKGAAKTNKILAKKMQDPEYRRKFYEKTKQGLLASPLLERQRELFRKARVIGVQAAMLPEVKAKRKDTFRKIGHQQGTKNSMYGTMWITAGTKESSHRIPRDAPIPDGYYRGRVCS